MCAVLFLGTHHEIIAAVRRELPQLPIHEIGASRVDRLALVLGPGTDIAHLRQAFAGSTQAPLILRAGASRQLVETCLGHRCRFIYGSDVALSHCEIIDLLRPLNCDDFSELMLGLESSNDRLLTSATSLWNAIRDALPAPHVAMRLLVCPTPLGDVFRMTDGTALHFDPLCEGADAFALRTNRQLESLPHSHRDKITSSSVSVVLDNLPLVANARWCVHLECEGLQADVLRNWLTHTITSAAIRISAGSATHSESKNSDPPEAYQKVFRRRALDAWIKPAASVGLPRLLPPWIRPLTAILAIIILASSTFLALPVHRIETCAGFLVATGLVTVPASSRGTVTRIPIRSGDIVRKDDPIAVVTDSDALALLDGKVVDYQNSAVQYLRAADSEKAAHSVADALSSLIESYRNSAPRRVLSPLNGRVIDVVADEGQVIAAGNSLVSLAPASGGVDLKLECPIQTASLLHSGDVLGFTVTTAHGKKRMFARVRDVSLDAKVGKAQFSYRTIAVRATAETTDPETSSVISGTEATADVEGAEIPLLKLLVGWQ